jgi:hypothetical protein
MPKGPRRPRSFRGTDKVASIAVGDEGLVALAWQDGDLLKLGFELSQIAAK